MLGNSINNPLGLLLANMLERIYALFYRPSDIIGVFTEFDGYIEQIFEDGWFDSAMVVIKSIGFGLLVVTFLMSLMDRVSAGDFTINNFFRYWLKFFIVYVVLLYGLDIFKYLLNLSSAVCSDLSATIASDPTLKLNSGMEIETEYLKHGINKYMSLMTKLSLFMMCVIPYLVSYLFSIAVYFFAVSRLLEMTVRIAMAPIAIGGSLFSDGLQSEAVVYAKRTMGLFFQIVVVLLISVGLTVTHMGVVSEDMVAENPANILVPENDLREINVNGEWRDAVGKLATTPAEEADDAYTGDSIEEFVDQVLDPQEYFISIGVMLAGLFMIFKSRELSIEAFS